MSELSTFDALGARQRTFPQLRAMVKQARTGGAPRQIASVEYALHLRRADLEQALRETNLLCEKLHRKPAAFADGFSLNPPVGYKPVAYFDCGEVHLHYHCEETDDYIDIESWPFNESFVYPEDLEKLGFEIA